MNNVALYMYKIRDLYKFFDIFLDDNQIYFMNRHNSKNLLNTINTIKGNIKESVIKYNSGYHLENNNYIAYYNNLQIIIEKFCNFIEIQKNYIVNNVIPYNFINHDNKNKPIENINDPYDGFIPFDLNNNDLNKNDLNKNEEIGLYYQNMNRYKYILSRSNDETLTKQIIMSMIDISEYILWYENKNQLNHIKIKWIK